MSKVSRLGLASALIAASLPGTTLEQLSLDQMTLQSTGVVRAKVTGSSAAYRGVNIYTHYQLEVAETWKGAPAFRLEVAVPGGVARGIRQSVAGAPVLTVGEEYVLFLWAGRSGMTQLIGLSQGVFRVRDDGTGNPILTRAGSPETSGGVADDPPMSSRVSELRSRVRATLDRERTSKQGAGR
jgi:hypothetical protein